MRILIYEHTSSGGLAGKPISPNMLAEGYAMLRGLVEDFKAVGDVVTVLFDSRVASLNPPILADEIVQINNAGDLDKSFRRAAEASNAVYVIAPESNEELQRVVAVVEETGTLSANSSSTIIAQAADKVSLSKRALDLGLSFPKTIELDVSDPKEKFADKIKKEIGYPAVIKPANGAGCEALYLAQNETQISQSLEKIKSEGIYTVSVQEFIKGNPASVSLICNGSQALPVSLNLQDITLMPPEETSRYNGGLVPFFHPMKDIAFSAAKKVVESFQNLQGYVGVDLILSEDKAFVLEVNPRLTTSFVGLRRVSKFNLADAILKAVVKSELPQDVQTVGFSSFLKVPMSRPVIFAWREFCQMNEVISPPFPIAGEEIAYALIGSWGQCLEDAFGNLLEIKEKVYEVWQKGQHPW